MKSVMVAAVVWVGIGVSASLAQTGNRVISGFVATADGQPLAGATVTLTESGHSGTSAETTTDAQGRFDFTNLADGRFEVTSSHRGYVTSAYNQHGAVSTAIVTGENLDSVGIVVSLTALASIFGTVTEDSGDPVPQAQLHLFREDPMRGNAKERATVTNADEMGYFDVSEVVPGTYYLCATGRPWYRPNGRNGGANEQSRSPLDVAYPPGCYSDTADPEAALPITVKGGDHLELNLILHAVPAVRVSFQIPKPERNQGVETPQLSQNIFGAKVFVMDAIPTFGNPNEVAAGGTMTVTLTGLAPGQYEAEFPEDGSDSAPARFGSIRASSSGATVEMSALQSAAAISGKVEFEGSGKTPDASSIALVGDGSEEVRNAQIEPDGRFHINSASPGDYEIRINGGDGFLAVSHLRVNGVAKRSSTLHVGLDPLEVSVFASASIASVSGLVVRNGQPTSGVFVVLVPEDLHAGWGAWILNQSDSDGSFVCDRVPPGRYTAVAIDEGWKLDWRRPEVISPYLARGVAITIPPGLRSAALKSPLEAQSSVAAPAR